MTPDIWTKIFEIIIAQGFSGVINIILGYVVIKLFNLLQAETKAHRETASTAAAAAATASEALDGFREFLKDRFPVKGGR